MKRRFICIVLVFAMILGILPEQVTYAAENEITSSYMLGHWSGTYGGTANGTTIERNISLDIDYCDSNGNIEGYAIIDSGENGSYFFDGYIDFSTGKINFVGTDWYDNPSDFGFGDFEGICQDGKITGNVDSEDDRSFEIIKTSSDYQTFRLEEEDVPKEWSGEYDGHSGSKVVRRNIELHITEIKDGNVKGTAMIFPSQKADVYDSVTGSYCFSGTYDARRGKLNCQGYEWIQYPVGKNDAADNFEFIELTGYISNSSFNLSGFTENGIWEMTVLDTNENVSENAGSFYYASGSEKDYMSYFFYNDTYFDGSAYDYQSELATMSMCMAFSAFGSNRTSDYTKKSQNLKELLGKCGFPKKNFDTNKGFTIKPQRDTIGVGASYKTIKDKDGQEYTLIALGVRGGGYESEWASNFTLGESGTHKGFTAARDQVLNFLKDYIANKNISGKVKIWIAGYSRAAATTNMVAGSLDDGYSLGSNIALEPKDIYAFCFECPQGALKNDNVNKALYKNIFYIINPVDIVTKVAPTEPSKEFGFSRYGVAKYLPTNLTDNQYKSKRTQMLKYYNSMASTDEYIVDDFQMKKISVKNLIWDINGWLEDGLVVDDTDSKWDQQAFLDTALFQLFSMVGTRQKYVEVYENDIREICSVVFGSTADQWTDFANYLIDNLKKDVAGIAACVITSREKALINRIEDNLVQSMKDAGITNYSTDDVKSAAGKIASLLLEFGISHPNYTITMISNIKGIGAAHYPELCLAWLMSFDPNYLKTNAEKFGSGAYRVLRINCPVDVKVYDGQKDIVAEIRNDNVDSSNELECYINEVGEKLVYLPFTEEYTVEMSATDNGKMDYSINEYSEDFGGMNRVINYYSLPLSEGKTYTSEIPAVSTEEIEEQYENGTDAAYNIVDENGMEIKADIEVNGSEVIDSTYMVEVEPNNIAYGSVTGNEAVIVGGYARVTAVPNEGYRFSGWYSNGNLVSTESEYRFLATQDTKLTAHFTANDTIEPSSKPSPTPNMVIGSTNKPSPTPNTIIESTNKPSPLPNNTTGNSIITSSNKANKYSVQTKVKSYTTKINLKNKKTYRKSKKVLISDKDGLKTIEINGKTVKLNGRRRYSFKLLKYKKHLKKKSKWNKLVVTDMKNKKKTIIFKTK